MIEIGRICMKTAGRDAGLKCAIIDILDDNFVLIDGETRRRKCNILHLEPLNQVIKIKKNASHEDIKKEFEAIGLKARETKPKPKTEKPVKKKKSKDHKKSGKGEKKKPKAKLLSKGKTADKHEESLEEKAGLTEEKKEVEKKDRKKKTSKKKSK
jgi:large subunit ribosomal protein L14e